MFLIHSDRKREIIFWIFIAAAWILEIQLKMETDLNEINLL